MIEIKNSTILRKVLVILISISGRRSSDMIACAFIEAILKSLEIKYNFLKYINIKNITYHEGLLDNAIHIKSKINAVDPKLVGESIESIVRVLCMDLEEDTGLFFIQELKTRLSDKYRSELSKRGVDLNLLKVEQKHFHEQLERKKSRVHHDAENKDKEIEVTMPNYAWSEVAAFKYRNNICFLYDKKGALLDRLDVGKLIEYYVRTLTDFGKLVLKKQEEIEISEKQRKLLRLLYERDVEEEAAKFLLDVTQAEFNRMIQLLLRYEFLQYLSFDEIKLTKRAIELIEEENEKEEETVAS